MKRCSAKPYEGNEKYIFVSYCHKDKEMVFPIIEQLVKDGYRIWYDEGIDPGTEWPEIIAQHLNECLAVLAFITENSLNSHNCRREISFALLKKKLFISIILEPVKMSPGIEMQLSATQSIYKYKLDYEDEFYNKINNTSLLDVCKDMNKMTSSPSPIPNPEPNSNPKPTPNPNPKPTTNPNPKPNPNPNSEPTPPPYIPLKKLLYIIVSMVVVIIAAIVGFMISNHKDKIDIAGTTEAISVSNEISEIETTFETTTTEVTTTEEKSTDENTEGSILEESTTNETTTTKPTATEPTTAKPTTTKPITTKPTTTKPTTTEPTTKPTTTKLTPTKPTTTKPTTTEPTTTEPTTTEPTTAKPTTTESTTTQKLYANLSFKVPDFPIYTDHNGTFTLTTNANVASVKIYDIVDGKNGGSMSMKKSGNSWIATANIYLVGNHAVTAYVKLLDGTEIKSNTVYFSYPY